VSLTCCVPSATAPCTQSQLTFPRKGHYGRALEEAIQTQKSQWPRRWNHINPLSGGRSFNSMTAADRITLLHTLCLWSLNQNEIVRTIIASGYKSRTTKDRLDTNIPLSVQPWGRDGEKRKYWLIEGQNDTHFRVYRETNPGTKNVAWWSVAGSIDELRALAKVLDEEDGAKEAKSLSERMINACPRFEASEVKRKRREYRISRSAAFVRPEPGFSLYEGRTRGKRQRYNFSDMEDVDSDDAPVRRSGRQSRESPVAQAGPTVTASGRQVRSRATGAYGETLHSGQTTDRASPATGDYVRSDVSEEPQRSRSTRTGNRAEPRALNRAIDSDEDDATSWDGGDEEDEPEPMDVDEDEDQEDVSIDEQDPEQHSLVVTLHYGKGKPDDTGKEAPSVSTSDPSEPKVISNGTSNPSVVAASSTPALPTADAAAPTPFTVPTPPYTAPEEASKPVQANVPQEQMETLQIETQTEQTTAQGVTAGQ
jgi:hypothetical protein